MGEPSDRPRRRGPRLARQFGEPRGLVGHLVGRGMARGNGELNRWVVATLAERVPGPIGRIVELGSGPGVGLVALLHAYPEAQVWGIDRSPVMVRTAQRRAGGAGEGRLSVRPGDIGDLAVLGPVDVVMAVHVLYFWADPARELAVIRDALGERGVLALGYQLRSLMPGLAQRGFPAAGHRLYDDDQAVRSMAIASGFSSADVVVKHGSGGEEGRVLLAHR